MLHSVVKMVIGIVFHDTNCGTYRKRKKIDCVIETRNTKLIASEQNILQNIPSKSIELQKVYNPRLINQVLFSL